MRLLHTTGIQPQCILVVQLVLYCYYLEKNVMAFSRLLLFLLGTRQSMADLQHLLPSKSEG